jgi:hypothetical protein
MAAVSPTPVGVEAGERPFFVVGCPRSGTTLLKSMLDAHPRLAIPYESHFLVGQGPHQRWWRRKPVATVDTILAHPCVRRWNLDPARARAAVAAAHPESFSELSATLFDLYAADRGKQRWGDKTPGYVTYIPVIDRLFPTAQFIHIVRDGREVAVSLSERGWGPASPIAGAFWWRRKTQAGLRAGRALAPGRYLEVHLEDLVGDPEGELRRICAFLDEDYAPQMLDYPDRVEAPWEDPAATAHLNKAPTANLRDWRTGRTPVEREAIDSVCAPLLAELGYERVARSARGIAYAYAIRLRDLPGRIPVEIRLRRSRQTRLF